MRGILDTSVPGTTRAALWMSARAPWCQALLDTGELSESREKLVGGLFRVKLQCQCGEVFADSATELQVKRHFRETKTHALWVARPSQSQPRPMNSSSFPSRAAGSSSGQAPSG